MKMERGCGAPKEAKMSQCRANEFINHVCRNTPISMSENITPSYVRKLALTAFEVAGGNEIDRSAFEKKLFTMYPDTEKDTFSKKNRETFINPPGQKRRLGLGIPGPERSIQITSSFFNNPDKVPFRQGDTIETQRAIIIHALANVFIDAERKTGVGQVPILNAALEKADKQYPLEGSN